MENNEEELQKKLKWYEDKYGPYYETRGLKNWKNLFRKPTLMEGTVFIVLILMLFGGWAYNSDTKSCRDTLENLPTEVCEACREFQLNKDAYEAENYMEVDFNELNITFVNESEVEE